MIVIEPTRDFAVHLEHSGLGARVLHVVAEKTGVDR